MKVQIDIKEKQRNKETIVNKRAIKEIESNSSYFNNGSKMDFLNVFLDLGLHGCANHFSL